MSSIQKRISTWVVEMFGEESLSDKDERVLRVLEEALELAQALGITREKASSLADRVYSRPVGEPVQKVSGVGITIFAMAESLGVDALQVMETEYARISDPNLKTKILKKHLDKVAAGFGLFTNRLKEQP